jgi:hypothetical protein
VSGIHVAVNFEIFGASEVLLVYSWATQMTIEILKINKSVSMRNRHVEKLAT